ncbi:MAG: hypothetical protein AMXMBFR33_29510 [Candidatus Xenobia bacterium]
MINRESNPEVLRLAGNDLNELMTSLGEIAPSESAGVERELTLAMELEEQSWKSARSHLRRAQRLRPWDGGLWRLEGDLLSRHSRWKGAEKAYRQACMLDSHRLPMGRRVFHPGDPDAEGYLRALDGLARALAEQGRWEDASIWLTERVRRCSETHAREALGSALHRAGRYSEAREQFRKLPDRDWRRHYNEAASWLEQGAVMSALPPLLRGLARNDWPSCTLPPRLKGGPRMNPPDPDYWECFGALWSEESKAFLRAFRADRAVRVLLSYLGKKRLRVRVVAPPEAMRGYARRALTQLLQDLATAQETSGQTAGRR